MEPFKTIANHFGAVCVQNIYNIICVFCCASKPCVTFVSVQQSLDSSVHIQVDIVLLPLPSLSLSLSACVW